MPRGLTGTIAAADADPHASEIPLRSSRRTLAYSAIGLAAYGAALIATWPARFVIDPNPRWAVSGTIWQGEVVVDGAYRVEWRWAPFRSLANLGFATDWRMTGSGTDLAGSAIASPGRLVLDGISGRGDSDLMRALTGDLPFVCDMGMTIAVPRMVIAGAGSSVEGEVQSDAGNCTTPGNEAGQPVPALVMHAVRDRAGVSTATIAPLAQPRIKLVDARLAGGRLSVAPTQTGVGLLPFLRNWRIDRRW